MVLSCNTCSTMPLNTVRKTPPRPYTIAAKSKPATCLPFAVAGYAMPRLQHRLHSSTRQKHESTANAFLLYIACARTPCRLFSTGCGIAATLRVLAKTAAAFLK
ncbi:hypothetical protein NPIL_624471 [Nephila pilipes]|uniref:Uncharacterized protein n=1 Tax=Nephila pilipes TaxID=299642 RepID=A0A8X6TEK6_NEPPI|nr:hypothetical protein NPIL_624471 [Nephila pilipes]